MCLSPAPFHVMPSKLKKAIGAVKDQTSIGLARVSSSDQTISTLEIALLKATTHDDDDPIDPRHVHEILSLVSSNKSNASACARAISKRIGRTRTWSVAIKSLLLVLRIFQDGDPYFPREVLHAMKRGAKILNLSTFRDDSSSSSPWDYSAFVRTFSLYLDERLDCFLTGKLQRRIPLNTNTNTNTLTRLRHKSMSGKLINETIREMKPGMLLDKISCWQDLLDRAVATRPTGAAKTNKLVKISLYAIVRESFDLYKDISDGLALLLEDFFHLQYNACVNVFQACVKATKQFEELDLFYDLCKGIGVGRPLEYPTVQRISDELLQSLQEFLKDQTSFMVTTPSTPNKTFLLQLTPDNNHEEESANQTSLEDLLSATELSSGKDQPSISIDLEAYPITDLEFEKQLMQSSGSKNNFDTCSTKSLPISHSNSIMNLLDDWPDYEPCESHSCEDIPPISWELVLFEDQNQATDDKQTSFISNGLEDLLNQQSHEGWELMLTQTVTPSSTQSPVKPFQQQQHYNPFLQYTPGNEHVFEIAAPTFQANPMPVFCDADTNGESDPFASNQLPVARIVSEEADQGFW